MVGRGRERFRPRRRCLIRVSNYHHGGQARKVGDKVADGCTFHVSCTNSDLRHDKERKGKRDDNENLCSAEAVLLFNVSYAE